MASPLQSVKCPNCGASIRVTTNHRAITCPYCASSLQDPEDSSKGKEINSFCGCGKRHSAVCVKCGSGLCDAHSLSTRQFNLQAIIRTYAPSKLRNAPELIQALHAVANPSCVMCSACLDTTIENWIASFR